QGERVLSGEGLAGRGGDGDDDGQLARGFDVVSAASAGSGDAGEHLGGGLDAARGLPAGEPSGLGDGQALSGAEGAVLLHPFFGWLFGVGGDGREVDLCLEDGGG